MQTFLGILLGGGVLTFVQFLISRHDKKTDELGEIRKSIDELKKCILKLNDKVDERDAVTARVRILRFADELVYEPEKRHSKDSFDQALSDISEYNHYCESHPNFKNDQTVATVTYINKVYQERLEKKDFL